MIARFRLFVTAVVVPVLMMIIVSYGFSTNYTRWVFGEASFRNQYERGIYRYRILGREGLLATNRFLREHRLEAPKEKPTFFTDEQVHHFDQAGDLTFYNAYVVWNTLGAVLSALVLSLMLRDRSLFSMSEKDITLWVVLGSAVTALTQFVMTPYDTIAYALLLAGAWASLKALRRPTVLMTGLTVALIALGALNRETAMLNVALVAAVSFWWYRLSRRTLVAVAIASLAFAGVYLLLRILYGTQSAVFDSFALWGWWQGSFNRLGALSLACLLALPLIVPSASLRLWALVLLCSAPYLVVTLGAGVAWEMRLWVPFYFLGVLVAHLPNTPNATPTGATP